MPTIAQYEEKARDKIIEAIGKETDANVMERRGDIEPASEAWGAAGAVRAVGADAYRSAGNQYRRRRPPELIKAADEYSSSALQCRFAARDFEKTAKLDFQAARQAANPDIAKRERKEAQDFLAEAANAHKLAAEDYAEAAKALKDAGKPDDAKERRRKAAEEYKKESKEHKDLARDYQNDPNLSDAQKNRLVGEESQKAAQADDNARIQQRLGR